MPVYFRRVQENHFVKSDRILNILTKAKSPEKHALEVRILPDPNSTWPLLESSIWPRSCRPEIRWSARPGPPQNDTFCFQRTSHLRAMWTALVDAVQLRRLQAPRMTWDMCVRIRLPRVATRIAGTRR